MATIRQIKNQKKGYAFQVDIRIVGYKRITKTFKHHDYKTAKKLAQKWASEIEVKMQNNTYVEPSARSKSMQERNSIKTMSELLNYFKKEIAPNRYAYAEKYNTMYDWWTEQIGNIKVVNLSAADISNCKQILINEEVKTGKNKVIKRSDNTINKYLMALSAVLTFAMKELELIEYNPKSKVDNMPNPVRRKRHLYRDEIPILTKACKEISEETLLFFLLLLHTGGRYSEVHTLQVMNFNFRTGQVTFYDTKNKTDRTVGIEDWLVEHIKKYLSKKQIESGYIFANKNKTGLLYMRTPLRKAIKNAGLEDFHIHDIRHTTGTILAEEGASLLEIAEILGHKSLIMARSYSHLTQKHTDKVLKNALGTIDLGVNID